MNSPELANPTHEEFQAGRLAHPRGFVLNAGRTLHVAECIHFGAMTRRRVAGKWDLGKMEKACDTSRATATGGRSVKPCRSCKP